MTECGEGYGARQAAHSIASLINLLSGCAAMGVATPSASADSVAVVSPIAACFVLAHLSSKVRFRLKQRCVNFIVTQAIAVRGLDTVRSDPRITAPD